MFYAAHTTSKASECVQLSCMITKPLFIYLMKLCEIIHFQQNVLIWSYIKRPNFQGVYINLIHKHVHKRITIKNITSWFMNKKFICYLH